MFDQLLLPAWTLIVLVIGWAMGRRGQHRSGLAKPIPPAESHGAAARLRVMLDQRRAAKEKPDAEDAHEPPPGEPGGPVPRDKRWRP